MKKLFIGGILISFLCACNGETSFRSSKRVTQGINYAHYNGSEAYYEFTSSVPTAQNTVATQSQDEELGDDEDFTSEKLASSYSRYGDVVVTVSSRKFQLGQTPDKKMPLFRKAVDTAYAKALRTYQPTGFTYALSSVGAVNPLSDVQIHCRMSERSANDNGQKACSLFFQTIYSTYQSLLQEANL